MRIHHAVHLPGRHRGAVHAVTTARPSRQEDRRRRTRHYLWAMGVRTVAFPLAVWALVSGWDVIGWTLAAAAVALPSVAVMIANAVDERTTGRDVTRPGSTLPVPRRSPDGAGGAAGERARTTEGDRAGHDDDPGPSRR